MLENYYLRGRGVSVNSSESVESYIESYLADCVEFNKSSTIEDKQRTLGYFAKHTASLAVGSCTKETCQRYLIARRSARSSEPISAERWNVEKEQLSHFFKWLQKQKLIDHNPAREVERKKVVKNRIPKALTRREERTLLRWCRRNDPELFRMAILVGSTGIRVTELKYLQWPDVAGDSLHVTAKENWKPKDYEERSIPMSPRARAVIVRQRRTSLSRWVFPTQDGERYGRGIDIRMTRAFEKAGLLPPRGFHRLRHTYATRAIEAGMDIEVLRKLMGHSDTKTLQKYMHVSPEHVKKQASLVKFGE